MRIKKTICIASAILLAVTVAGIALLRNRPTSKGDPTRMTEEDPEQSSESAPAEVPIPKDASHGKMNQLDLDVRDLAPKSSPAQVVDEQVLTYS